jgi:hypothetical protein
MPSPLSKQAQNQRRYDGNQGVISPTGVYQRAKRSMKRSIGRAVLGLLHQPDNTADG